MIDVGRGAVERSAARACLVYPLIQFGQPLLHSLAGDHGRVRFQVDGADLPLAQIGQAKAIEASEQRIREAFVILEIVGQRGAQLVEIGIVHIVADEQTSLFQQKTGEFSRMCGKRWK